MLSTAYESDQMPHNFKLCHVTYILIMKWQEVTSLIVLLHSCHSSSVCHIFMPRISEDTSCSYLQTQFIHFPEDTMLLYIPLPVRHYLMTPYRKSETQQTNAMPLTVFCLQSTTIPMVFHLWAHGHINRYR
jgi:hypothetical protein